MVDDEGRSEGIGSLLGRAFQSASRQLSEAKDAYANAKRTAQADLPQDEAGKARIVCRRYAERRSVPVDDEHRPACYDPDHPDCQGCVEDIRDGTIESW